MFHLPWPPHEPGESPPNHLTNPGRKIQWAGAAAGTGPIKPASGFGSDPAPGGQRKAIYLKHSQAVIPAPGYRAFEPTGLTPYGYGRIPDVVSEEALNKMEMAVRA
jgi:hypothetical protein